MDTPNKSSNQKVSAIQIPLVCNKEKTYLIFPLNEDSCQHNVEQIGEENVPQNRRHPEFSRPKK